MPGCQFDQIRSAGPSRFTLSVSVVRRRRRRQTREPVSLLLRELTPNTLSSQNYRSNRPVTLLFDRDANLLSPGYRGYSPEVLPRPRDHRGARLCAVLSYLQALWRFRASYVERDVECLPCGHATQAVDIPTCSCRKTSGRSARISFCHERICLR